MTLDRNAFVAWEEHIVNPEKGSRRVHFFLKKASGDLVLAVVGTERSVRHMLYVVSNEYLQAFGPDGSVHAGTKWRTRRDTVGWLTSIVSSFSVRSNKDVELTRDDSQRRGVKRNGSFRRSQRPGVAAYDRLMNPKAGNPETNSEHTYKKLKITLSDRVSNSTELVESPLRAHASKVGGMVEVLSHDSGLLGCWFRCKVLKASETRLKVQYVDLEDYDEPGYPEEWVPASRVANPDKLGIRCQGRLTVRPWPPRVSLDSSVKCGDIVDAWWADGWWEGVVIKGDAPGDGTIQVYAPGENRVLTVHKEDARKSRDWINGTWVELKATPDMWLGIPFSVCPDRNLHWLTTYVFDELDSYIASPEDRETLTIKEKCSIMAGAEKRNEASLGNDGNTGGGGACNEAEAASDAQSPK